VFEGDTIRSRSTVLGTRPSKSRPTLGVGEVSTEGFTQYRDLVIRFTRTLLVPNRHGPRGLPTLSAGVQT